MSYGVGVPVDRKGAWIRALGNPKVFWGLLAAAVVVSTILNFLEDRYPATQWVSDVVFAAVVAFLLCRGLVRWYRRRACSRALDRAENAADEGDRETAAR